MKHKTGLYFLFFLPILFIFSCTEKRDFVIEGMVKNGAGKIIYLENVGVNLLTTIDSVYLKKDDTFRFKTQNQTGAPNFYRVRLKNQFINVAIDSTEIIRIRADTLNFAKNYEVEGSDANQKIKELTQLQVQTNSTYNQLLKRYENKELTLDDATKQIENVLKAYKDKAKEYIFSDLFSSVAYFALFQQVNNQLIFDPYDRQDSRVFGAVANSWVQKYSDASRSQHLGEIFKNSLSTLRKQNIELNPKEISTLEALDFTLNSVNNTPYTFSEVAQGRVLLLDFTSYVLDDSPGHNRLLAEAYTRYEEKGFEIFQVSLDADTHFWKNAAINLPWICVNDPQSIYSDLLTKFNIKSIPVGYLLSKKGEIIARIEDYSRLEEELRTLLR